jgi:hypothetical protein|tara:strand:- start:341 stop:778 length:438 start_codon:yes stop_codon:yes gene_type:complete
LKIDDVVEMWKKDCKIDETELSLESLNVPSLHAKYLKIYSNEKLKLRSLNLKKKDLKVRLSDYYKGDLNNPEDLKEIGREPWPKKVLKQDLYDYVEGDVDMIALNTKIVYQEEFVDVLTEIIKSINGRGYVIKNSIDFLKFTMGS